MRIRKCARFPSSDVRRIESVLCAASLFERSCCSRRRADWRFICAPINSQSAPVGAHPSTGRSTARTLTAQLPKNSDTRSMHSIGGVRCTRLNSVHEGTGSVRECTANVHDCTAGVSRCRSRRLTACEPRLFGGNVVGWGLSEGVQNVTAGGSPTDLKFKTSESHEMRTTVAEQGTDRPGNDAAADEQEPARDNPRRRRESRDEREDDDRGSGTSRSPLRHGVQHVRNDLRRLARV